MVKYAGAPVFWCSMRQSMMALSTTEAEPSAQIEALVAVLAGAALVQVAEVEPEKKPDHQERMLTFYAVILIRLCVILEVVKRPGLNLVRKFFNGDDCVKVKLLHEAAEPIRGASGWICTLVRV